MQVKLERQRNLTLKSKTSARVEPLGRSSLRSRDPSLLRSKGSSNSSNQDKMKLFKNCLRKMVEFIFAQVGMGSMVVCYTIVGASIFQVSRAYLEMYVEKTSLFQFMN